MGTQSSKPLIGQIPIINGLRGLAALSVCLFHFVARSQGLVSNESLLYFFEFGTKGVQLFFVISGIVIPLSMIKSNYELSNFRKFILKRFIRIQPPYLAAVVLGALYLFARNFMPGSAPIDMSPSFLDGILNIFYLVPFVEGSSWISPVFWTLAIEFQYYLFLALSFPLLLSQNKTLKWVFLAMIFLPPFFSSSIEFFSTWSAYFGIGVFYALYLLKINTKVESIIAILFCSIAIYFRQGVLDLGIAYLGIGLIHFLPNINFYLTDFLGKISYSLYLIHAIVGAALVNFLTKHAESSIERFSVVIIALSASIFTSYFMWRFIEKPSQRFSKKISLKNTKEKK